MTDAAVDERADLLATIEYRRACVDAYVREKTPACGRLSTISIVSSAIAAALPAGPALGGQGFTVAVQDGLGLGWRSPAMLRMYAESAPNEHAREAHRRMGLGDRA